MSLCVYVCVCVSPPVALTTTFDSQIVATLVPLSLINAVGGMRCLRHILLLQARTQLSMLLFRPASYFYFCGPGSSCPCYFFDLCHIFTFAGQDPAVHVAFLNTLLTCFDPCLRQERLHLQFSQPLLFDHRSQT